MISLIHKTKKTIKLNPQTSKKREEAIRLETLPINIVLVPFTYWTIEWIKKPIKGRSINPQIVRKINTDFFIFPHLSFLIFFVVALFI